MYGHVNLIEFLHGRGADITMVDQYDATPLHYAAVQMCVQQQQQQTQLDEEAKEVEHGVAHRKLVRVVLARTEIVNLFDQQHRSPLIWAASCGNLRFVFISLFLFTFVVFQNSLTDKTLPL